MNNFHYHLTNANINAQARDQSMADARKLKALGKKYTREVCQAKNWNRRVIDAMRKANACQLALF